MSKNNVVSLLRPEVVTQEVLAEIAREGARQMLVTALNAEVEAFFLARSRAAKASARWTPRA